MEYGKFVQQVQKYFDHEPKAGEALNAIIYLALENGLTVKAIESAMKDAKAARDAPRSTQSVEPPNYVNLPDCVKRFLQVAMHPPAVLHRSPYRDSFNARINSFTEHELRTIKNYLLTAHHPALDAPHCLSLIDERLSK